jgi:hypothetical protein
VQPHAARAAGGLVQPLGRQVLLVLGVAGLVQHGHEGLGEVGFVVAGGDAHVARHPAAERVVADVQPPAVEVEPDPLHDRQPQPALPLDRERPLRDDHPFAPLALDRRLHRVRKERAQVGEQQIDAGAARARLEAVQERVVAAQPQPAGQRIGHLALAGHHLAQQRQQGGPVVLRAQRAPGLLAARVGARRGLDQVGGQAGLAHPAPLHLAQVRRLPG